MSLTPRNTLNDDFIDGMSCAICGNPNLTITHVKKFPDFVSCNRCGAAFVVENEGSWVMYGKIPAEYPETSEFALRQWTWLDAVAQRAADEREMASEPSLKPQESVQEIELTSPESYDRLSSTTEEIQPDLEVKLPEPSPLQTQIPQKEASEDLMHSPPITEGMATPAEEDLQLSTQEDIVESHPDAFPPSEEVLVPTPFAPIEGTEIEEGDQLDRLEDVLFSEIEGQDDLTPEEVMPDQTDIDFLFTEMETAQQEEIAPKGESEASTMAEEEVEEQPSAVPVGEPRPDKRYRVTIQGSQPKYPKNYCAHCLKTPVRLRPIMRGSLPDPNNPGKRRLVPLELPFCKDCQKRMNARSDEERNARLLAFLLSGLISVIAIAVTIILHVVNLSENLPSGLIILLIVAILGFAVPLLISLNWANRYPPPRDAAFVLSTLLVNDAGEDLTEFEWRNPGYAELFRQVNQESATGEVKPIQDRVTFTEIPPAKKQDKQEAQPKPKSQKEPNKEDEPKTDSQ
jgi:hypothetical protein